MKSVPMNSLQRRLKTIKQNILTPGSGETHSIIVAVVAVYDQEYLKSRIPPKEVVGKITKSPGLLFCSVRTSNGTIYDLPFLQPSAIIYANYGNGAAIVGSMASIVFQNNNINGGHVELTRNPLLEQLNLKTDTAVSDIGGII